MANHASALKAHRQSIKRRDRNRSNRSALRTVLKNVKEQVKAGKTDRSAAELSGLYTEVDKAVRKGVLSKNAAARHKSRITKHLNATPAPPQS